MSGNLPAGAGAAVGVGADPIAVVGVGCRLPGAVDSLESLWQLVEAGRPAIRRMPPGRFDIDRFTDPDRRAGRIITAEGGFLEHIDRFDAAFFGISPREAVKIDPQHRLLLELTWEALEDAAIVPSSLAGSRTGVYLGLWSNEYESVMSRQIPDIDLYTTTGGGRYAASGRISFALDLRGPSLTLDTGCSSSLVALHLACQALQAGEAEVMVTGAANLILQPYISVGYSRSGMLSPGARCRFGAPSPDGYVRSEGAVVVVLKRLSDAIGDGNPIHAVVLGSCVNADGGGSGLLVAPSQAGQAEMLRTAWQRAGVPRESVAYVEAHGTGTAAGDGVEVRALGSVLGRRNGRPLPVGSIKTLIGHTEAVAGLAGLLKAILVLRHGRVPADAAGLERNPDIAWNELGVDVVREPVVVARRVPLQGAPLTVGVNSFGVTGTNAHVVLRGASLSRREFTDGGEGTKGAIPGATPYAVAVSGRAEGAVTAGVLRLREFLDREAVSLHDLSYTTMCRREHHPLRLAIVAESLDELRAALNEHIAGECSAGVMTGEAGERRVGFVFSGQGSQWVGMGRELLARTPVFAAAIDACEAELRRLVDWSLREVLAGDVPLERVDVIQPTLTALQIALARLLESWGVRPAAVVGHSMGEVAAAHIAGALTLADAMRVITLRSRLLREIAGRGAMALVDLPEATVVVRLAQLYGSPNEAAPVSIAAVNGPRSTVISGDPNAVDALLTQFESEDVFCRRVNVDVASHSVQTEPLVARLRDELHEIQPTTPEVPFHSTVRVGEAVPLDADYWAANLRQPVRLDAAVQRMIATGVDVFVEISPHPILVTAVADIAADCEDEGQRNRARRSVCLSLMRRDEPEHRRVLELVARLHVTGVPVDWAALADAVARPIRLPAYPWQYESYWLERWDSWSEDSSRAVDMSPRPDTLDSALYRVEWRPAVGDGSGVAPDMPDGSSKLSGTWLLLESGEPALDDALTAAIRSAGGGVVRRADFGSAVDADFSAGAITGVIDLRTVTAVADYEGRGFDIATEKVCREALQLVQALGRHGVRPEFGVWWATRGAQGPGSRTPADSAVPQAALWGLVRTLWEEHPELNPHLVDLEPEITPPDSAAQMLTAILAEAGSVGSSGAHGSRSIPASSVEAQIAFANGRPHVARLVRPTEAPREPARWRPDVSYLLTGGLGEIGIAVAETMVHAGARRLVLAGRSGLPPRQHWDDADLEEVVARRIEGVLRLERLGASVHICTVDISDYDALAAMLAQYRAEHFPDIAGVIHLAGALDNNLIRELTIQRFMAAVRGKATGAWNLHRLLPDAEHIYFSSIVAVLPQAGQSNYAAANALLDALACARRGARLPSVSLAWGVWENTGLVRDAQVGRFVDYMKKNGLDSFAPETAVDLFRWTARSDAPHVVVGAIDWAQAAGRLERRPGATFYSELIDHDEPGAGEFAARVIALSPVQRRAVVLERVRATAASVLRTPAEMLPVNQPLGRRGLDSLMAMELRNRLEADLDLQLAVSVIWNYPTIESLAAYLLARIESELAITTQADKTLAKQMENADTPGERGTDPPVPEARADEIQVVGAVHTRGINTLINELANTSDDDVMRMLQEAR